MAHSLIEGKRFFCREWVFSKILHCLEGLQRRRGEDDNSGRSGLGILIMSGPGGGKTAVCSEIVSPTMSSGKQLALRKKLIAHHFCQSHDLNTLSVAQFLAHLVEQLVESQLLVGYAEKIQNEDVSLKTLGEDPDVAFKRLVAFPLLEIDAPKSSCFLLIDSIDEACITGTPTFSSTATTSAAASSSSSSNKPPGVSNTIGELLGTHCHLLPPWLVLICTARKNSKSISKLFSGFRKISLDDLRKSQVVRDVQQYILSRLDQDYSLRQHIRRETAEMLNQLHIKSNGCFLYLEKVLDGISENFIVLREIREIPGTLYGLYCFLVNRLFTKKQFSKVQPILCILLASRTPMQEHEIFACLQTRYLSMTKEDYLKRANVLRRVLIISPEGFHTLFHHSFSEWFLDVKYCTQKYLCQAAEGHLMKGLQLASRASELNADQVAELAHHLANSTKFFSEPSLIPVFLLSLGITVFNQDFNLHSYDIKVHKLLGRCGVKKDVISSSSVAVGSSNPPAETSSSSTAVMTASGATNFAELGTGEGGGVDLCYEQGGGEAPCENLMEESVLLGGVEDGDELGDKEEEPLRIEMIGDMNHVDYNQRTPLHNAANDGNLAILELLITHGAGLEATDRHGRTPLNLAARQGHEAVVKALIEAKADVNHADHDGWTPLRSSAWAGHVGVVDILLECNADVDLTDGDGRTALRAAAWGGHEEVVNSLLRAGASPSLPDNEGRTPLIASAYMGHADIVDKLLNAGADVNHSDSDGRTALSVAALCVAASQGHLKVVNLLLERNSEVDHQDRDGTTPLLVAAFEGHKEVCELLLEFEADVDAVDKAGRTPLWAGASMGHSGVCELLLFWGAYVDHIDGEGRTVLSVAAAQGNVSVVRLLLARGLDEGHRDNAGWTPLHYSSFEGHQEVTEVLAESGAKLNEVDNDGKHALLLAAQEGHISVVETLLNLGADINQKSHDGRTALRAAAIEGYRDVVQLLVHRGADVNYRDADGRSTLYLLALESRTSMAQFIIRCGADVEDRDLEGRTPLHVSAWQGHLEMVELLVSAGAEVNAVDNDRRTPLQSASWQGHGEIVRLLCERGSKIDHTCNQGASSLCIAAQEGHLDCVRTLLEWGANPMHSDRCGRTPIRVALKSGHAAISKILEEVALARSKTLLTKGINPSDWETTPTRSEENSSDSNNKTSNITSFASAGFYRASHTTSASYEPTNAIFEAEKRKSAPSSTGNTALTPGSKPFLPEPESSSHHHASSKNQVKSESASSKQYGLSFTQQVQQMSRHKGRPGSRLLSPLQEPHSPIYASPPQSPSSDSVNDDRISPMNAMFSNVTSSYHSSEFISPVVDLPRGGGGNTNNITSITTTTHTTLTTEPTTVSSNGIQQSFAFNRDSHMKIILGSGTENGGNNRNSRKNGVVNSTNSGIINATSAIRSGFTALKAGVLEAAAGRRKQHNDSVLVSGASMAVPNQLVKKKSNNKSEDNCVLWKRETPL